MRRKHIILILPLIALIAIGILSGNVYSLGHFKDQGGPGGTVGDCNACHNFATGYYDNPPTGFNLRWVNTTIYDKLGNPHTVKFTRWSGPPADGTLADGVDTLLDGPCEVCHTTTNYHRNTPDGKNHFDAQNCTVCHPHFADDIVNYFEPRFIGTQSHITHFDDIKGPRLKELRPNDYCTYYCHLSTDFSKFKDNQPLATTNVCDSCHSKGGAFDGVDDPVIGAKPNWTDSIYTPAGALKDGKEQWCVGCHDSGTSVVRGVQAPNVAGSSTQSYGYYVNGHGRNPQNTVRCDDCHDITVLHTDSNARTYSASVTPSNYKSGYRLNTGMDIPRLDFAWGQNTYRLCFNCHIYSDVFGPQSNFRDDNRADYLHDVHLGEVFRGMVVWDSDWNSSTYPDKCFSGQCADSAMSCPACHNVHGTAPTMISGTPYQYQKMVRHGELISTPGTTDKVPALNFRWYKADAVTPTTNFNESRWGSLLCGPPENISLNYVCWGCHTYGEVKYYRVPGGPEMVTVNNVWTTDWSDNPKTVFAPGAQVRYHVSFKVNGPLTSYSIKSNGKAQQTSGNTWSTTLTVIAEMLPAGTYERTWDRTIPAGASSGSGAKVTVTVKMRYTPSGTVISENSKTAIFRIQ